MSKTPPLVVIGTVAIDELSTPFGARQTVFGGSASFFSYAASFFARVGVVAVVGEDFPEEYRDVLKEREIDLSHLDTLPGKTFHWKGKYESDMNSAITLQTDLNVLLDFKPKIRYEKTPEFVFLANIDPDLQLSVLDQMHGSALKFVACDTMNFWIQSRKDAVLKVLGRVHAVFMNDGEARQLTGEVNLIKAAQQIYNLGPEYVIIKKGEHGALLYSREGVFIYPAYPLETVYDPTGAGDSFAGGVMGYLASARKVNLKIMKTAIAYGTVVASFTVEKFGMSRLREVKREHFDKRLEVLKKICKI
ncbi:MAG TPA: PfkB family carbohydrate kinase [Candidatus Omnitrophota bacterium]|jgi:sugar/nucleoside kinase (ribokinase family)|nr:MAG: putative sugar kinase YdjH [Candidatus Omnitrophica bacterium ADurb.Bin314]HOE69020.1 PfkB family carbohydrate kinase [Candidatus Omnitrophota bacterium]HQB93840.1 PfkB family carbohydrate kinase [Candidatus Omnitrophota bacterium]